MSASPLNAASPPKEPRLSPNTNSWGRESGGSLAQASYTPLNRAWPVSFALDLSTRKEIQLGR